MLATVTTRSSVWTNSNLLDSAIPWQRDMADRAQALRAKLIANPSEAQHQLDARETKSVRNLGLERSRR